MLNSKKFKITAVLLAVMILLLGISALAVNADGESNVSLEGAVLTKTFSTSEAAVIAKLYEETPYYVVVRHKQLGGSHYAYTEYLAEDQGVCNQDPHESETGYYYPGSQLVLVSIEKEGDTYKAYESVLVDSPDGFVRDPDISKDGTQMVFSWKQNDTDDFHLYIMELSTREYKQITFGSGIADTEPKFLSDGSIVFSSSRAIQSVDCYKVPVSNLYKCNSDGTDIIRLGYDQVHTTYPTVTNDGRIIYTRWDYNDRTQLFVQGVFQMFEDGAGQTELYGNNSSFPTSLLHTRQIPNADGKYLAIASGHHNTQKGKLVLVDIAKDRNGKDALEFVFPDSNSQKLDGVDYYGQSGAQYCYPYALSDTLYLYSKAAECKSANRGNEFKLYAYDTVTKIQVELAANDETIGGAVQVVPVYAKEMFTRPSMVNYAKETGTFYVSNVYEGAAMEGIEVGTVKQLRVVELEFRSSAIGRTNAYGEVSAESDKELHEGAPYTPISTGTGSWDVKKVHGVVDVYEDGSALFEAPANAPLYFQLLDENGSVVQTMRSWTTLMPGEYFSCVGCHVDKNTAPTVHGKVTQAMRGGVKQIEPEAWMDNEADGFSFVKEIQPILDRNCISCHNDNSAALNACENRISVADSIGKARKTILELGSDGWSYLIVDNLQNPQVGWNTDNFDASAWATGSMPMGNQTKEGISYKTDWKPDGNNNRAIYVRKSFEVADIAEFTNEPLILRTYYDANITVYINGKEVFKKYGRVSQYEEFELGKLSDILKEGTNTIAISLENTIARWNDGTQQIDAGLISYVASDEPASEKAFALTGDTVKSSGDKSQKRNWPLSYLVLTQSYKDSRTGYDWMATPDGKLVNFLSTMSGAEIVDPYTFGSSKSHLLEVLENGHNGVALSDTELRAIRCWIDLAVPAFGEYDENAAWTANDRREFEEKENKRDTYDGMNKAVIDKKAGRYDNIGALTIEYSGNNTKSEGEGFAMLNVPNAYAEGDRITVTLPAGQTWLALSISSKMGESLIYCPNGTFTYTFGKYLENSYPSSVDTAKDTHYVNNVIFARIPRADEINNTRNLAQNVYDLKSGTGGFPHVTSVGDHDNYAFAGRCAIDGFSSNTDGHTKFPNQSWGPDQTTEDNEITVDFGREVTLERLEIIIRYDTTNNHDTYFKKAVVTFSDGSTQELEMVNTADVQGFELGAKKTTKITLSGFEVADTAKWAAISEIRAIGE